MYLEVVTWDKTHHLYLVLKEQEVASSHKVAPFLLNNHLRVVCSVKE